MNGQHLQGQASGQDGGQDGGHFDLLSDVEHIERRAYVGGWWWGFASGLICGCGSTALLAVLLWFVAQALGCPQC